MAATCAMLLSVANPDQPTKEEIMRRYPYTITYRGRTWHLDNVLQVEDVLASINRRTKEEQ